MRVVNAEGGSWIKSRQQPLLNDYLGHLLSPEVHVACHSFLAVMGHLNVVALLPKQ